MLYHGFTIGVFYKSKTWVEKWMDDFLNSIDQSCVLRFVKNGVHPFMIDLKDGTRIIACQVNENARGRCIDKAYVEPTIDQNIIDYVIRPLLGHSRNIVVEYEQ